MNFFLQQSAVVGNGPQSKISEFETTFINQELFKKIGSPYLCVEYVYYKSSNKWSTKNNALFCNYIVINLI